MPSFPSKQVTHGYLQAPSSPEGHSPDKGTHIPAVRPAAGSQSRQLYLYLYLHVFTYKIVNIRRLNYSYWCEMILKKIISNICLYTH